MTRNLAIAVAFVCLVGGNVKAEINAVDRPVVIGDTWYQQWLKKNPRPERPYHVWHSANHKYSAEGQLISVANNAVTIRTRGGALITVSRYQLSGVTNRMLDGEAIPKLTAFKRALKTWGHAASTKRSRMPDPIAL